MQRTGLPSYVQAVWAVTHSLWKAQTAAQRFSPLSLSLCSASLRKAALPSAACAGGENCGGDPQFQPRVTAACGCRGVLLEPLYDWSERLFPAIMADAPATGGGFPAQDYPTIDPTSFDVVLCGTGLPESVLAAACAAAWKTVLHVDPNPFYGSLFSSLPLPSLPSFLSPSPSDDPAPSPSPSSAAAVDLRRRSPYSEVETSGAVPEPSRRFTADLVGPRLLYCADEAVDLLLRSGGSHHVEFKSVEGGTLLYWDGDLYPVPDSRQAIFKDTTLQLREKNLLFRFFKLVQAHIAASAAGAAAAGEGEASGRLPDEDLDLPFVEFLKRQNLSPKMRA